MMRIVSSDDDEDEDSDDCDGWTDNGFSDSDEDEQMKDE